MMNPETTSTPDWFDHTSDWCNPILVKEVRQALKSRAFVATFLLLLLGSWLISAFGLLAAGARVEYGSVGQAFFTFYFGVLCIAVFVVAPFGAFRSLLNERDDNTYELLSITTLTPGQIVRGKWVCAIVQTLLFYSAIAPFIAFTSLLQGFDVAQATVLLAGAFYLSVTLSITTLMMSTTVRQRVWQGLLSLMVLSGLLSLIFMVLSGLSSLMMFPLPLDEADFWWAAAILFVLSMSYQWLFYQIAASRLTFESENRSTGIRLTASGQFWLLWLAAAVYHYFRGVRVEPEVVSLLIMASGVHWAALGLSLSAEPDSLSRRVRRTLPDRGWLRPLFIPLLPGGTRGFLFVLLHLVALWILAAVAWSHTLPGVAPQERLRELGSLEEAAWTAREIRLVTAVCAYIVVYSGLAACFLRWGSAITSAFQGAHARTMVVILVACGMMGPMGVRAGRFVSWAEVSIADVLFPFWLLGEVLSERATAAQLWILIGAAAAVIGLNAPALVRSAREVLAGPHRSTSRPHIVPGVIAEPAHGSPVPERNRTTREIVRPSADTKRKGTE